MGSKRILVLLALGCCFLAVPSLAVAHEVCCEPSCCAPPPPIETIVCLQDPCTGCTYEVSLCVPPCCGEPPCVTWRNGIFGRRIAILSWECCGHSAKVIVTRRGRVIVRG